MRGAQVIVDGVAYEQRFVDRWAKLAWKWSRDIGPVTAAQRLEDMHGHAMYQIITSRMWHMRKSNLL